MLERWASVLDRLGRDPQLCAAEVEWVAKLRVIDAMRRRDHLAWDHPRLAAMDFQWSDVRPERGLYHRLVAAGAVERLVTDEEVERAVHEPPDDTRAYFRGTVVRRFADVGPGRELGLGGPGRAEPADPAADPAARPVAGHPGPRRRAAAVLPGRRDAGGTARPALSRPRGARGDDAGPAHGAVRVTPPRGRVNSLRVRC